MQGRFDGEAISTDGGGLLPREVAKRRGIARQFAACLRDHRKPERIALPVAALVAQRVCGLARAPPIRKPSQCPPAGYETPANSALMGVSCRAFRFIDTAGLFGEGIPCEGKGAGTRTAAHIAELAGATLPLQARSIAQGSKQGRVLTNFC